MSEPISATKKSTCPHATKVVEPLAGETKNTSYQPIVAIFINTALLALASCYSLDGTILTGRTIEWFIAFSMVVLAILKFQDINSFAATLGDYDLLAKRWPLYGRIYPFAEAGAGILMIAGICHGLSIVIMLFIGTLGALSVFKTVFIDRRKLICACVGGNSKVPLGFVSLIENVMMVAMAMWMLNRLWQF